jgi:hypothetical protein
MKFLLAIVLLSMPVLACNDPIVKVGKTCPLGYYSSNGYCVKSR